MMICLLFIIVFAIVLIVKIKSMENGQLSTIIPTLITATVSFITGIIGIPLVITNYLFDNTEDEKLIDLIEKMQAHDIQSMQQMSNEPK